MRSRCWCKGSVRRRRSNTSCVIARCTSSRHATCYHSYERERHARREARRALQKNRNGGTDAAPETPCRGCWHASPWRIGSVGIGRRKSGAESRFFIGVQFWRVTVRASRLGRYVSIVDRPETRRAKSSRNHEQRHRSRANRRHAAERYIGHVGRPNRILRATTENERSIETRSGHDRARRRRPG
ncbi:hypothetical protein B0G83_109104 [Paraburkholderia sp. BL21I4N1]|nr:hypothetical protein B0G83_109104 [Paraburkholderia sp. BL21I4N1]